MCLPNQMTASDTFICSTSFVFSHSRPAYVFFTVIHIMSVIRNYKDPLSSSGNSADDGCETQEVG